MIVKESLDDLPILIIDSMVDQDTAQRPGIAAKPPCYQPIAISSIPYVRAELPDKFIVNSVLVYAMPLSDNRHRTLAELSKDGLPSPHLLQHFYRLCDSGAHCPLSLMRNDLFGQTSSLGRQGSSNAHPL